MVKHKFKPLADAALIKPFVHVPPLECTCDHRFGAIPHAGDCPAKSIECNCSAFEDADIDHAAACPLGVAAGKKAESDAAAMAKAADCHELDHELHELAIDEPKGMNGETP
jgi:hypothetical protein